MNTDNKKIYKQGFFPLYIEVVVCNTNIGRLHSGDICLNEKGTLIKFINFKEKIVLTQEEANFCHALKINF